MSTVAALRAALVARCDDDSPPGAWRSAAAAVGVSGADAFLCHLSRSIAVALECLAGSAAEARARLQSAREDPATRGEKGSHFDDLEERIASVENSKRTALELELCAVDAALEKLRSERVTAAEAAASLDDSELVAKNAELVARLDAADAQLLALPTSVVEPPYVGLVFEESALQAGESLGRVIDPRAIVAADLTLDVTPTHAYPEATLLIHLTIRSVHHVSQSAEELEVSLGAAAAATHVEASLQTEGAAPQHLQAVASVDVPGRCLPISIVVPATAPVGSSVCFGPLTVSGQPVAGLLNALQVKPPGPTDLSPEHVAWLQSQLPPGGSSSPGAWEGVYRATVHGFKGKAFHERCDGRARLLVLVRAQEGGWLFGGFTAVGFSPPIRYIADPDAFLFSLTNSLGRPEKLESRQTGMDLFYTHSHSATFGRSGSDDYDLFIWDSGDPRISSYTHAGEAFAESASTGAHPMARGMQEGWTAAEVVAWVV